MMNNNTFMRAGCAEGFYGNCTAACGHCKNDAVCDKQTGACPSGCKDGYQPQVCTSECSMILIRLWLIHKFGQASVGINQSEHAV